MFCLIRSEFADLGMTIVPRWTPQLITICAGVTPCLYAMALISGSSKKTLCHWPRHVSNVLSIYPPAFTEELQVPTERGICCESDTTLLAECLQFEGWQTRVELDLVSRWNDCAVGKECLKILYRKIRHANGLDLPCSAMESLPWKTLRIECTHPFQAVSPCPSRSG